MSAMRWRSGKARDGWMRVGAAGRCLPWYLLTRDGMTLAAVAPLGPRWAWATLGEQAKHGDADMVEQAKQAAAEVVRGAS